ncbi:MAG: molybdopterin converting factor subunit 1 [Chloroflexota bacterium]|nr:molybdopterin converting factor subunit 1 [Chloroflexota bacterium]
MKIRIRYFASLREVSGESEETLEVREGANVSDVRALLVTRYPRMQAVVERAVCAVNREYVPADTLLHDGDELVFIPPLGGGELQEKLWSH